MSGFGGAGGAGGRGAAAMDGRGGDGPAGPGTSGGAPNGAAGPGTGAAGGAGLPGAGGAAGATGPGSTGGRNGAAGGGAGGFGGDSTELRTWLESHRGETTYLAAAFGAQTAAQLIVASDGAAVLPIGGFNGTDAAPTLETFVSLVETGQLRYVIGEEDRVGGPGGAAVGARTASTSTVSAQIRAWVEQNCATAADAPSTVYVCG